VRRGSPLPDSAPNRHYRDSLRAFSFILVGPSLWKGEHLPLGLLEVLVTAGVGALSALCYTAFLQRVPILPIADPLLARRHEA